MPQQQQLPVSSKKKPREHISFIYNKMNAFELWHLKTTNLISHAYEDHDMNAVPPAVRACVGALR